MFVRSPIEYAEITAFEHQGITLCCLEQQLANYIYSIPLRTFLANDGKLHRPRIMKIALCVFPPASGRDSSAAIGTHEVQYVGWQ